ncbi:MAG: putative 2-hydroxyacid dehydrogenase [Chlamydiales bacterium]|nr:putative 2-hydroxyacid dehydrogenase [Chlamydiales bacterium]MCH9619297.1 putative 2-hydroxyacid dehydrogenase [Chlamydiales bacterium]MCH9622559.1 putative 2-hydroxyacid dehydrogenase [Chlamydiales bacterium]
MPKILLQQEVPLEVQDSLEKEFPQYDFITECEHDYDWHAIEVIYGSALSERELELAPRLRWIHCPGGGANTLCSDKIRLREEILISYGARYDATQTAEFVMGAILSFSKQFFHWKEAPHDPEEFWNWPLKQTVWTLKDRLLLQVGSGRVGTEVVRMANFFQMKSWGVRKSRSFHPYCQKTFSFNELHSILPAADVVVLTLPKKGRSTTFFGAPEFKLMKPDSILIIVGSGEMVDETALVEAAKGEKFRGVLIDAFSKPPPRKDSPLWEIPNGILTPQIAGLPETEDLPALRLFRRNLRSYIPGKVKEMKNLISL